MRNDYISKTKTNIKNPVIQNVATLFSYLCAKFQIDQIKHTQEITKLVTLGMQILHFEKTKEIHKLSF